MWTQGSNWASGSQESQHPYHKVERHNSKMTITTALVAELVSVGRCLSAERNKGVSSEAFLGWEEQGCQQGGVPWMRGITAAYQSSHSAVYRVGFYFTCDRHKSYRTERMSCCDMWSGHLNLSAMLSLTLPCGKWQCHVGNDTLPCGKLQSYVQNDTIPCRKWQYHVKNTQNHVENDTSPHGR